MSRRRGTRNDTQETINLTPLSVWFVATMFHLTGAFPFWSQAMITQNELKELIIYDDETGEFRWAKNHGKCRSGTLAGCVRGGYRSININKNRYLAHRLAWLYVYGEHPHMDIDHINEIKTDNRISNLRIANRKENIRNQSIKASNTSGFKGVHYKKDKGRWCARIRTDSGRIFLGYYSTPEDAHKAYVIACHKYHGDFSNVG